MGAHLVEHGLRQREGPLGQPDQQREIGARPVHHGASGHRHREPGDIVGVLQRLGRRCDDDVVDPVDVREDRLDTALLGVGARRQVDGRDEEGVEQVAVGDLSAPGAGGGSGKGIGAAGWLEAAG